MKLSKLFQNFAGAWSFTRYLTSRNKPNNYALNIAVGSVKGTATFERVGENQLHYKEEGVFTPIGKAMFKVQKEYLFLIENNEIKKYSLQNGKNSELMYPLQFGQPDLKNIFALGEHLCGQDTYQATYEFDVERGSEELFHRYKLTYDVTGPEKDYIALTMHERQRYRPR